MRITVFGSAGAVGGRLDVPEPAGAAGAVALLDEAALPWHRRTRFTVAY
ncbi:hypothetical protein ACTWPT_50580 [Nonomuraea sp. 3N208]